MSKLAAVIGAALLVSCQQPADPAPPPPPSTSAPSTSATAPSATAPSASTPVPPAASMDLTGFEILELSLVVGEQAELPGGRTLQLLAVRVDEADVDYREPTGRFDGGYTLSLEKPLPLDDVTTLQLSNPDPGVGATITFSGSSS